MGWRHFHVVNRKNQGKLVFAELVSACDPTQDPPTACDDADVANRAILAQRQGAQKPPALGRRMANPTRNQGASDRL